MVLLRLPINPACSMTSAVGRTALPARRLLYESASICYHALGWGCGEDLVGGRLGNDGV